ncbi:MAG: hypothetical protein J6D23_07885 [Clostridia bacterium]|nr:hypothetical protein [Clostridia bacterium]
MEKYIKPSYIKEYVEACDVILSSMLIEYIGEGSLGGITGNKAQASMSFDALFGNR